MNKKPNTTNPLHSIKKNIIKTIKKTYPQLKDEEIDISLEVPPGQQMGDFGFNCFDLAKKLKDNPAKISKTISEALPPSRFIEVVSVQGPFMNFLLKHEAFISELIEHILTLGDDYGFVDVGKGKGIMVEYSAPNTNKPQHLGHVRNNITGMSLSNILEKANFKVHKVNLVNDRGIHISKSMMAYKLWGEEKTPESEGKKGDHFVGDYYVLFEQKSKNDLVLLKEAHEMLIKWEQGDKEVVNLWKKMNGWVYEGFDETYRRLGCEFEKVYYESETYKLGKDIVYKGLKENHCYRDQKGDIVIDLRDRRLEKKVLLRSDDTAVYVTQDLGTTVMKFNDFDIERSIFVVASEQQYHFNVLFTVLDIFGYEWAKNCYHLGYGMVYLPEGKMKSREGKVIDADNLMDELHSLAEKEILKRNRGIKGKELEEIAESIGIGAIKYYLLRIHPLKDINFNPEESISFEGTTGPYIQYTHARISSIMRMGGDKITESPDYSLLDNPEEIQLSRLLAKFPDIVRETATSYNISRIANYLFNAAKSFNKFYHDHSILSADNKKLIPGRVALCKAASVVIREGLKLLGIEPLEKM